ncbi:MAG: helix-turn-helix domain-containing protein [Oscillospiraceae bacterium]|nr:helix-turn-helix domain-containing protein [Oscillospiraceae bacterium]MBR6656899.1 helix-turn-helix domain-containing protein [Oscillospiraceae bacterium]
MTDKKTFGSFIKSKRIEKNYSQKELAEMLYVTEGAVSKWERGISYPDITLISDICRILDISEHEFITSSTDTSEREMKRQAKNFRVIRGTWFWVPTISYIAAAVICFICNLAVDHTLSWFFVVLAALVCAYSFIPTFTSFFESKKLLVFASTSYLSICLLLFVCAVYTKVFSWFVTACIGVLMGYALLFLPILLSKTKLSRWKFLIAFGAVFVLAVLMIINIRFWETFPLWKAIIMTCYGFVPVILSAYICTLKFDAFLKAGICTALSSVMLYLANFVAEKLFGPSDSSYRIDFYNWEECVNGNVNFICLLSLLFIAAIFFGIGAYRIRKANK